MVRLDLELGLSLLSTKETINSKVNNGSQADSSTCKFNLQGRLVVAARIGIQVYVEDSLLEMKLGDCHNVHPKWGLSIGPWPSWGCTALCM